MKVKDIFTDKQTKIFVVTDEETDDQLDWTIESTELEIIPEGEQTYFVKAKQVFKDKTNDCYISIVTPERIADFVVKLYDGKPVFESISSQENSILPASASDCFGAYDLYYAKENPQIGIDILKDGLTKATNKNVVAEDLGYILRDESRIEEAIEAFLISEQNHPSSEFIYRELSDLYDLIGQTDKHLEYKAKYKENGGL